MYATDNTREHKPAADPYTRNQKKTITARRARSEAARQADCDEFRHDVRANGCRGLDERD